MKQMTKEELIEYFIEQLGDNEILGQVMTIEQIREKLQAIIKEVTYSDEIGNFVGQWKMESDGRGIVNFNLRKISPQEEKQIVVHELLHALSASIATKPRTTDTIEKCGILYSAKYSINFWIPVVKNMAINEGMTDFLAEQITNSKHNGYIEEKSIYKVLSIIIGQDTLIKKAFGEDVDISQNGLDIFREEFIAKYGESTGNELNEIFKKVSALSDQLLDYKKREKIGELNIEGMIMRTQLKDEIFKTLDSMIETIFELEHDLNKKIEMIIKLEKMCDDQDTDLYQIRKSLSKNILWNLFIDESIGYTQKLEEIKKIQEQGIKFQDEGINEVFSSIEEVRELSIDEKIEAFIQLKKGKPLTMRNFDIIYDLYIKSGKILEGKCPKKELLESALYGFEIDSIEKLDEMINKTTYYKLGEYYVLSEKKSIFDEDGNFLYGKKLNYNPISDEEISDRGDIQLLSKSFSEDKAKIIAEQIQENFKQYKVLAKGEDIEYGVRIIGNIIKLYYFDRFEKDIYYADFFSVDDNGNLELIPERRKEKNNR